MHVHANARVWNFVGRAGFSSDCLFVTETFLSSSHLRKLTLCRVTIFKSEIDPALATVSLELHIEQRLDWVFIKSPLWRRRKTLSPMNDGGSCGG